MERKACQLVWVDPIDCIPPHGLDMSSEHDLVKVEFID